MRTPKALLFFVIATLLWGCSSTPVEQETLGSLSQRTVKIDTSKPFNADIGTAISAYEGILQEKDSKLSLKAMHNLADLEMQRIDMMVENNEAHLINEKSYDKAIKWYREILLNHPKYPEREQILYSLARAYEQSGNIEKTLNALKIILRDYPRSSRAIETGFRRGELLFQIGRFREAEVAYAGVVTVGRGTPFHEQALFKYAWSIYRQDRCVDSLNAFFVVLDLKLNRNAKPSELNDLSFLSRAELELVNDSFRAVNLCFTSEGGAKALNRYLAKKPPRIYEFILYKRLAKHYLKQMLPHQAAETLSSFTERAPWHPYSLLFQDEAIDIYTRLALTEEILPGKRTYVEHYEKLQERWGTTTHSNYFEFLIRSDENTQKKLLDRFEVHLHDLAEYYHARAQKTGATPDYKIAIDWYKRYLKYFPKTEKSPNVNFLLAEALFEDKQYLLAAREYERTAYEYDEHENANTAGYAALAAYEEYSKAHRNKGWAQTATQSALTFSRTFRKDPRAPEVLAKAADELYQAGKIHSAVIAAETLLNRYPRSDRKYRRMALIVLANTQFEQSEYEVAELFYLELQAIIKKGDPLEKEISERIAASIYKQAEYFRKQGVMRGAIEHFQRLIKSAPNSTIRPIAEFDIATTYIQLNEWESAMAYLNTFKKRNPNHRLIKEVNEKIAIGYMQLERPIEAASALEGLAEDMGPDARREALWQVAELYDEGGEPMKAAASYVRYADTFSSPLEDAIEALYKAAVIYRKAGQERNYFVQMEKIYTQDHAGGAERTDRTRYLAAKGVFELAEPHFKRYAKVRLVEPIRKNMQLKNKLMKQTLKEYNKAAEIGVAEFSTAATFRIADMYADFSRKLMDSDRPSSLNEEELEQYEIMLEEQAFPFEEKAIALHENNLTYLREGLYNDWIIKSINALAELMPAFYLRNEYHDVAAPSLF